MLLDKNASQPPIESKSFLPLTTLVQELGDKLNILANIALN